MANSDQTTSLKSKRQKPSLEACSSSSDRISNLPDDLIHRILSFLPTKQAVATSVLSKRWVWLWTLVPSLNLEDSYRCGVDEQAKTKFMHFVYRVLLLNKAASIEKFRLNCSLIFGYSCIKTWICSAIGRGLQEVDITGHNSKDAEDNLVKLPSDLFLVKTLKVLKLRGEIMVDVSGPVCLPNLKILHLDSVNYGNVDSVRLLISGCRTLEDLCIDATISPENRVNLNISAPTLKILSLHVISRLEPLQTKVEIDAPSLKYLKFSSIGHNPVQYFVDFPCLFGVHIHVFHISIAQLLSAVKSVQNLSLRRIDPLEAQVRDSFPLFVNLTQLELSGPGCVCWMLLSLFLQNSPKLETLRVHSPMLSPRDAVGSQLTEAKLIPICFSSSLMRATFIDCDFLLDELKVVEHFLKNASVLRKMEIYTGHLPSDSKLCILKKLSSFPRSSPSCQLFFH